MTLVAASTRAFSLIVSVPPTRWISPLLEHAQDAARVALAVRQRLHRVVGAGDAGAEGTGGIVREHGAPAGRSPRPLLQERGRRTRG
ncbi:MAG: hypothetical protein HC794_09420 [Nitrospiraceae bacterium]|nr:hypothetical protein [Nitrospiraceae bacterium]